MKATIRPRRIPRSYSTSSLDLVQLLQTNLSPSLITESITLDSLPSLTSLTSVNVPVFPQCRGSSFQLIGLGEHLRLFSSESMTKSDSLVGGAQSQNRPVLSAPTSPRLTKLMKECLSIEKWAEASHGWHAPGHIPWEKIPEPVNFSWTPEGSVYSRETFMKALKFNRSARALKNGTELHHDSNRNSDNSIYPLDGSEVFRPSEQEIRDMMSELRRLRSYFQDSLQSSEDPIAQVSKPNQPANPAAANKKAPALPSSALATRRGKPPPSRLFLSKKHKPKDLSYPGIPTAFLGSPTGQAPSPNPIGGDHNLNATMNAQDMIQNLRSQCSAMLVQKATPTPAMDSTIVNERPPGAVEVAKPITIAHDPVKKVSRATSLKTPTPAPSVKLAQMKVHRVPPPTVGTAQQTSVRRSRRDGVILKPSALQSPKSSPTRVAAALPPKTVRFETAPVITKKLSIVTSEDGSQSSTTANEPSDPIAIVGFEESALRYKKVLHSRSLPPAPKYTNSKPISQPLASTPWKKDETTTFKTAVNYNATPPAKSQMPFLHSSKSATTKEPRTGGDIPTPQHPASTPGRNSLSRIIRGPMFSAQKEIKRETVCMGPKVPRCQPVDNRPSSEIVGRCSVEKRKSRMPGPLRSIFTRFK